MIKINETDIVKFKALIDVGSTMNLIRESAISKIVSINLKSSNI